MQEVQSSCTSSAEVQSSCASARLSEPQGTVRLEAGFWLGKLRNELCRLFGYHIQKRYVS